MALQFPSLLMHAPSNHRIVYFFVSLLSICQTFARQSYSPFHSHFFLNLFWQQIARVQPKKLQIFIYIRTIIIYIHIFEARVMKF